MNPPPGIHITCPACHSTNVSATEFFLDWEDKGKCKKFSDQVKECWANDTYGFEECPTCGNVKTACKKYGGECESEKCRRDRMSKERPRHFRCRCQEFECGLDFVHDWYPGREDVSDKD